MGSRGELDAADDDARAALAVLRIGCRVVLKISRDKFYPQLANGQDQKAPRDSSLTLVSNPNGTFLFVARYSREPSRS